MADLRGTVEQQTKSMKSQEAEVGSKREELNQLRARESELQRKLESSKLQLSNLDRNLEEGRDKVHERQRQIAGAVSLNASLEAAIERLTRALADSGSALSAEVEQDLKTPAEQYTFTAGAGGQFELIDPFQKLGGLASSPRPPSVRSVDAPSIRSEEDPFASAAPSSAAFAPEFSSMPSSSWSTGEHAFSSATTSSDPFAAASAADSFGAPALPPKSAMPSSASQQTSDNVSSLKRSPPPRPAPPSTTVGSGGGSRKASLDVVDPFAAAGSGTFDPFTQVGSSSLSKTGDADPWGSSVVGAASAGSDGGAFNASKSSTGADLYANFADFSNFPST